MSANDLTSLQQTLGPAEGTPEHRDLATRMRFNYRQLLGELMYAYVICRLDISYAVTFMARFSQHPTEYHYKALKNIARYLRATKSWGLMYWRSSPCQQLPHVPFETVPPDPSLPPFPDVYPRALSAFRDA